MSMLPMIASPTRSGLTQLLLLVTLISHLNTIVTAITETEHVLSKGFTATLDSSTSSFQSLLTDSFGNYSLGFLRVNESQLALAVIHVHSNEPLWIANTNRLAKWSKQTRLTFNGSLVIFDSHEGIVWSSDTNGDSVRISNTSNLVIEKVNDNVMVIWQSFDFPYNTLMENQNFTSSMTLVSSNGIYSMKLGSNFMGFYANFKDSDLDSDQTDLNPKQMYFKHDPLEAKARVIGGQGPIRAILSPDGFLGMYQIGSTPVDVQPFSSFQEHGVGNRCIRLESDGNLIGYFWTGSSWVVDFKLISDPCELPSTCGSYGLCQPGKGCSCLDNRMKYISGRCEIVIDRSSDLCGMVDDKYRVLRKYGVELPYKEIMAYKIMASLEDCESACEQVCTCWGAVYSNTSGFCYTIDYPIQTLVEIEDKTKVGYFKVMEGTKKERMKMVIWLGVGVGLLCGAVITLLGVMGLICKISVREKREYVQEEGVGPYKDLRSNGFKTIELRGNP